MNVENLTEIKSGFLNFYSNSIGAPLLIAFEMEDETDCCLLQKTLNRVIKRYPYFSTQLVWKDGDVYLAPNDNPMVVENSDKMRELGSKETGFHLLEVHAFGHFIYLHVHHGIMDGNGFMPL